MSKTKDKSDKGAKHNGILYGMMQSGKTVKVMRDRRDRRMKDARRSFQREEW